MKRKAVGAILALLATAAPGLYLYAQDWTTESTVGADSTPPPDPTKLRITSGGAARANTKPFWYAEVSVTLSGPLGDVAGNRRFCSFSTHGGLPRLKRIGLFSR
jgi:hypothetical protein